MPTPIDRLILSLEAAAQQQAAGTTPTLAELQEAALSTLEERDREQQKRLLLSLVQTLVSCPPEAPVVGDAVSVLWTLACSNSGHDVEVLQPAKPPTPSHPRTGVLILGFAGANMGMLKLHMRTFQEIQPTWRVVATTGDRIDLLGATEALRARAGRLHARQVTEVERALAGCDRIVVHSMSNNGHAMWIRILRGAPSLVARVCTMVFECGVAPMGEFSASDLHQVLRGTFLASAMLNGLAWKPPPGSSEKQLGVLIDPALAHAVRLCGEGALNLFGTTNDDRADDEPCAWQAVHDPSVPTLILTSAEDEVVPERAVRVFAKMLADAQPARSVRVETIRGGHVRLLPTSPQPFKEHLRRLLVDAGLGLAGLDGASMAQRPTLPAAPPAPPASAQMAALVIHEPTAAAGDAAAGEAAPAPPPPPPQQQPQPQQAEQEDPKYERVLRRLDRLSLGSGAPLGTKEVQTVQQFAAATLADTARRKRLLGVLLQLAVDVPSGPAAPKKDRDTVQLAVTTLFGISVSVSGTAVHVRPGAPPLQAPPSQAPEGSVGVLLLGFGGASTESLLEVAAVYAERWPRWKAVMTTRVGLVSPAEGGAEGGATAAAADSAAAVEAQRGEVLGALSDCAHVVVHAMSNNGHGYWHELLGSGDAGKALAARVRCVIYDCAPSLAIEMPESFQEQVLLKTIAGAAFGLGVHAPPRVAKGSMTLCLGKAVAAVPAGAVGVGPSRLILEDMIRLEPRVPTLFLTSPDDVVVPEAGVRSYAAELESAHAGRHIHVASLEGGHCQLHTATRKAFIAEIDGLVGRTSLGTPEVS